MAESTTNKTTTSTRSRQSSKPAAPADPPEVNPEKPMVAKDIDPNQIVTVRNGFQGMLVYKSRKTGERFIWEEFGDEQDMELSELKNARNSSKAFFEKNWFMFDEPWIVDYLGVSKFYKHAVSIDDFDKLFESDPEELKKTISEMSNGQKRSLAYRAKRLISEGAIDSRKVVAALEEALNMELVEK